MIIENKVTSLYASNTLTDEQIQVHIDEQNASGFSLVAVDNLVGWYRFFWEKKTEE